MGPFVKYSLQVDKKTQNVFLIIRFQTTLQSLNVFLLVNVLNR